MPSAPVEAVLQEPRDIRLMVTRPDWGVATGKACEPLRFPEFDFGPEIDHHRYGARQVDVDRSECPLFARRDFRVFRAPLAEWRHRRVPATLRMSAAYSRSRACSARRRISASASASASAALCSMIAPIGMR